MLQKGGFNSISRSAEVERLCLLYSVNTTDTIHGSIGSSTFMRKDYRNGILLRAIILTHVLYDCFAYEVTRLVSPYERRVNSTGDNIIQRIGVSTSGVNLA